MRRIYTATIVDVSRKMNRALALGKGIGLDADSLACLAAIGVNDLVQQKAAEYLREQALRRSIATGTRMPAPPSFEPHPVEYEGPTVVALNPRHRGPEAAPAGEPNAGSRQYKRAYRRHSGESSDEAKEHLQRGLEMCRPRRAEHGMRNLPRNDHSEQ